jgi:thioredoxin
MMDELEQIKARKIADMMKHAEERERLSHARVPIDVTDDNFESTIRMNKVVVVDCWAVWCYPCRLIAPIVDELAKEYGSAAFFAKLNVDENPLTASKYYVQSIPTILIMKDGVEAERVVGALPKTQNEAALKRCL